MIISNPIESLAKTSILTIRKLKLLGIDTYWDLLNYFPFRYENYSLISTIEKVQPGEKVTVQGKIIEAKYALTRKGTKIQKFILSDGTGKITLIWFNQSYLLRLIKKDSYLSVAGTVDKFGNSLIMEPNEYEIFKEKDQPMIHTGRIIPIYPERAGLSSKTIREKIYQILNDLTGLPSFLPPEIVSYNNLIDELTAYRNIHFPENMNLAAKARERLAFDELFTIQLSARLLKKEWQKEVAGHQFSQETMQGEDINNFIKNLPFQLTEAQKRSLEEIKKDLIKPTPMNRFLQGDVGSGKTVVAAIACFLAYLNGCQSLFMAPTEILANQHYQTITNLLKKYPLKVGLQTKTVKINKKKGKDIVKDYDIIIGTHALLNENLTFEKIGLVVIDEQHRFGVVQRSTLKEKGVNPHLLTMTATPIPRTAALTLYGELDLSLLDEMPKGRLPIKTYFVPREKRPAAYQWIKNKIIQEGVQVFIVYPLIEESSVETMKSVKAAKKEFENLKLKVFPEFKVGLIHGKMKSKDKEKVMAAFKNKKYDILVATSLVEVGIDIANATIMLIEGAERFGLAQLHQLRGRVGRGDKQSYCFLFTEKEDAAIVRRLEYFAKVASGIKLAEYDLKARGPGDIYGTKQHGYLDLKIASLSDSDLIRKARNAALYFSNKYLDLEKFPEIKKRVSRYRQKQIARD